ncbi:DUF4153 domain-containing protein [Lichenibacterium ramalinae]|uniref:DUF4173 domain-containing protein n=1 Tax=Lichenibacterium ramalinae TaxID=2316527 RepID=A0A4Q2R7S8_9HYPH|nr:DUF4153 domain-containing protein [Lichenibacterium ramalinae]RYB02701.1 DUF4173 domain-containing protein [Lichenibacterium ramalinae]
MTVFVKRGLALRAPGLFGPELVCVAVADRSFWLHGLGLSVPLFFAAVAATAWTVQVRRVSPARRALAVVLLLVALAPAVDRLTPLSSILAVLGTAFAIRLGTLDGRLRWGAETRASTLLFFRGPVQAVRDLRRRRASKRRRERTADAPSRALHWLGWIVPAVLFTLFLALLASANPVISRVVLDATSDWGVTLVQVPRCFFWLCVLAAVWPAIRIRRPCPVVAPPGIPRLADARDSELEELAALLRSSRAVSRALLVLCALLALQLGLDGAYLWGALALPQGITYADYAHRGAYPLVVTALLAAALVLVVRRPGGPPVSRANAVLLVVFLMENVLLVASAMQRLALYVAVYGLTQWRVAAFAWMGLVAVGVGLVVLQGMLRRDNRWLVTRSLLAALAMIYAWCLADVPGSSPTTTSPVARNCTAEDRRSTSR